MDSDENVVLIGKKGPMNYVLAVITQFDRGSMDVVLKARGKAISKAVDIAEIVRHRFAQGSVIRGVEIGTDELTNDSGKPSRVSTIEITLSKS